MKPKKLNESEVTEVICYLWMMTVLISVIVFAVVQNGLVFAVAAFLYITYVVLIIIYNQREETKR